MAFADIHKKVEAEMERQRLAEEEARKSRDWAGTLGKVALGAGAGYLTGGLANALLPAVLGGTGAGIAGIGASLAPNAMNVLPALQTGSELLKNPDKDALATGIGQGVEMPLESMKAKAESSILDKLGYKGRSVKIGGTTGTATANARQPKPTTPPGKGMEWVETIKADGSSTWTQRRISGGKSGKDATTRINNYYRTAPSDKQDQIDKARSQGHSDQDIADFLGL